MPKMESTLKATPFPISGPSILYLHCTGAETIFKLHGMPSLLEKTKKPEMAILSTVL
ncbi:hypothetical protein EC957_007062 [Mortierella hygrophila]|uniref:Uncharacterized protein n=1 Tax=Mortierella hygrophila TaxID=979708 RepID=A0A9P6EZ58_9FUNG|nr:hypothetical protein EC957_007062 [Mortierella hygrophila]